MNIFSTGCEELLKKVHQKVNDKLKYRHTVLKAAQVFADYKK